MVLEGLEERQKPDRSFLAARKDIVQRLSEIAKAKHLTLFGLVNEALEQMIRVNLVNKNLKDIVDEYEVIALAKNTGSLILLGDLWQPLIVKSQEAGEGTLATERAWHEAGHWYGRLIKTEFSEGDRLETLGNALRVLLWGSSDFSVTRNKGTILLRCIGPRFPQPYTELLAHFLEGIFSAYGCALAKRDVSRGVIMLMFELRKPLGEEGF